MLAPSLIDPCCLLTRARGNWSVTTRPCVCGSGSFAISARWFLSRPRLLKKRDRRPRTWRKGGEKVNHRKLHWGLPPPFLSHSGRDVIASLCLEEEKGRKVEAAGEWSARARVEGDVNRVWEEGVKRECSGSRSNCVMKNFLGSVFLVSRCVFRD